jgi:hypothetical protein
MQNPWGKMKVSQVLHPLDLSGITTHMVWVNVLKDENNVIDRFRCRDCVMQSFGLLLSNLYWTSLAWVSIPSSIWIHRDVWWFTEFRCRLALDSYAVDSVDIRVLAFGRRLVTQKGERRGISIGHKLEGILKLIRHISLISQTVWSSHMATTEKGFRSVRFIEKSWHWTWLISFVNLTDESVELHVIRFSVTNTDCFGQ